MRYFVQFTAGTGGLVRDALAARLDRMSVAYADDSAMILDSTTPPATVAAVPFLKNAFLVVATTARQDLAKSVSRLSHALRGEQFRSVPDSAGRFRLMAHLDGGLVPIEARARSALERAVARHTGARLEPRGSGQEYWVVGRSGLSELLFGARLPKTPRPPTAKGALAYELAAMLVAASAPTPDDRFLDPFGGSGALVAARAELPAQSLGYSDLDLERHRRALAAARLPKRVRLLAEDALTLPSIADGTVDAIVTDPPWGEHEDLDRQFGEFAAAVGESFRRVLHPTRGRYVLLINRRNAEAMHDALAAGGLPPSAEHPILVNGHPATVLIGAQGSATARR